MTVPDDDPLTSDNSDSSVGQAAAPPTYEPVALTETGLDEDALLELDRKARERGVISALICDAGMTEFHGEPTYTCLALEPLPIDRANELTGDLPLY